MPRDGCAVPTAALSAVLTDFVSAWNRTHTYEAQGDDGTFVAGEQMGAYDWLVEKTAQLASPVSKTTLRRIQQRDTQVTELRHADSILTAIGREHLLSSGAIETIPNPKAEAKARASCCSTSELRRFTGSTDSLLGIA